MSSSDAMEAKRHVISICGGYGFPISASAARIIMIGKALQKVGIGFEVLHCGPSPISINSKQSGVYEGIPFQYTTPVRRPQNRFVRLLLYAWGLAGLTVRLVRVWPARRSTVVYLYVQIGLMNLYAGALCQLLGLRVVQELCEWPAANPTCSAFDRWLYRKRIFNGATGALVISKAIEKRVSERRAEANPDLLIHLTPVLVDAQRFALASSSTSQPEQDVSHFVWCGTWYKDVFFLIRAFALVRHQGCPCKLMIIGECGEKCGPEILDYAREKGLSPDDVILTGCVDDRTLEVSYKRATGLLMPLWDDEVSITRLPNKMGEYLASGRPVITCDIGDLTNFLTDNMNAYVGKPGDERDFADRMIDVLEHPAKADQIGAAGQRTCFAHLDYRAHVSGVADFFLRCLSYHKGAQLHSNVSAKQSGIF